MFSARVFRTGVLRRDGEAVGLISSAPIRNDLAAVIVFADRVSFVILATDKSLSAVTTSNVKTTRSGEILILASPTTDTDGRTVWENALVTIKVQKKVVNSSFIKRLVALCGLMVVWVISLTL